MNDIQKDILEKLETGSLYVMKDGPVVAVWLEHPNNLLAGEEIGHRVISIHQDGALTIIDLHSLACRTDLSFEEASALIRRETRRAVFK